MKNPDKTKYNNHRYNAKQRNIDWQFTFESWMAWWQATGHYHERGRRIGQYVMARFGDVGPYSPANVFCCTSSHNHKTCSPESLKKMAAGGKRGAQVIIERFGRTEPKPKTNPHNPNMFFGYTPEHIYKILIKFADGVKLNYLATVKKLFENDNLNSTTLANRSIALKQFLSKHPPV